jgi:hypothetical protein
METVTIPAGTTTELIDGTRIYVDRAIIAETPKNPATLRVKNLRTGEERIYMAGCTSATDARMAVIAAYAQSRNDWNTWDYESRYGSRVERGFSGWYLGDWGCPFED